MTFYTGGIRRDPFVSLEQLEPSQSDVLMSVAAETLKRSPSASLGSLLYDKLPGLDDTRMMSKEEATEYAAQDYYGQHLVIPDEGMTERHLKMNLREKKAEMIRASTMGRAPQTGGQMALNLTTGLLASVVDPLNIAAGYFPVFYAARTFSAAKTVGGVTATGMAGRAGQRMAFGATEGLVGAALVEPIVYAAAKNQNADYDAYDSMAAIAFGTVFGGGLHAGFGAIGDSFAKSLKAMKAKGLIPETAAVDENGVPNADAAPVVNHALRRTESVEVQGVKFSRYAQEDQRAILHSVLAQLMDNKIIDVNPLLKQAEAKRVASYDIDTPESVIYRDSVNEVVRESGGERLFDAEMTKTLKDVDGEIGVNRTKLRAEQKSGSASKTEKGRRASAERQAKLRATIADMEDIRARLLVDNMSDARKIEIDRRHKTKMEVFHDIHMDRPELGGGAKRANDLMDQMNSHMIDPKNDAQYDGPAVARQDAVLREATQEVADTLDETTDLVNSVKKEADAMGIDPDRVMEDIEIAEKELDDIVDANEAFNICARKSG